MVRLTKRAGTNMQAQAPCLYEESTQVAHPQLVLHDLETAIDIDLVLSDGTKGFFVISLFICNAEND